MTQIVATNAEAEHLVDQLAEWAAIAAPPGDVLVTVDRLGNRARPGRVFVDASTVGTARELGALAHEYAHVLEPDLGRTLRRLRWWYIGAPLAVVAALLPPAVAYLGDATTLLGGPFVVLGAIFFWLGARASQPGEFEADARAAELLGPAQVDSLIAMLRHAARNTKPGSADWYMPHPNPHRRIAAVRALLAAEQRAARDLNAGLAVEQFRRCDQQVGSGFGFAVEVGTGHMSVEDRAGDHRLTRDADLVGVLVGHSGNGAY